jgi:hypothetical protein
VRIGCIQNALRRAWTETSATPSGRPKTGRDQLRCAFRLASNGLRLSGDGGEADGVRCSRGLGVLNPGDDGTLKFALVIECSP